MPGLWYWTRTERHARRVHGFARLPAAGRAQPSVSSKGGPTMTIHDPLVDREPATNEMTRGDDSPELKRLYQQFEAAHLTPLWTQIDDLMPLHPRPKAVPHVWRWSTLYPLAQAAGELVPVGRGGE